MKNPCRECIIRLTCKFMCDDCKLIWGETLNESHISVLASLTSLVLDGRIDKSGYTMYWWFEELIRELKERN